MAPFAPRPSHGNSHLPRPRHAHQNMKNVLATLAVSATTGEWIAVNKLIRLKDFPAWSRLSKLLLSCTNPPSCATYVATMCKGAPP